MHTAQSRSCIRTNDERTLRAPGGATKGPKRSALLSLALAAIAAVAAVALLAPEGVNAIRYRAQIIGGKPDLDVDGRLRGYFIFAEERAVVAPTPRIQIIDLLTGKARPLSIPLATAAARAPVNVKRRPVTNKTYSRSMSESRTIDPLFASRLRWYTRSQPFGALPVLGPRSWVGNGGVDYSFNLSDWKFQTAGTYSIGFNATFYDGTSFVFNQTIFVNRQPAFLANGPTPAAYNGTAWSPAPLGVMQNILGLTAATGSVNVTLRFQAAPDGAQINGTLSRFTATTGIATFSDIVVSIPGTYTYQLTALLSDNTTKTAPSVQIDVLRALPIRIERLTNVDSLSRFASFEVPRFRIVDQVGAAYDPTLNMTLSLSTNSPLYSYEGRETAASISGTSNTAQTRIGYLFEFPGFTIDLPGTYEIVAAIRLSDASTLRLFFVTTVTEAPTWEFPGITRTVTTIPQNDISIMRIFGTRPPVDDALLMLSSRQDCSVQASDIVSWPSENATVNSTTGQGATLRNFSMVAYTRGLAYPCMKIPSQPTFGVLVRRYLQQFDERFPFVVSVTVSGSDVCRALSGLAAAQYRSLGWSTAEVGRFYGCALTPPASGTVPPCACPSHLTCGSFSHPAFTPPGHNIGTCQCCAVWIMAIAAVIIAGFFGVVLFVVYAYV
jgi:hypothetical protein